MYPFVQALLDCSVDLIRHASACSNAVTTNCFPIQVAGNERGDFCSFLHPMVADYLERHRKNKSESCNAMVHLYYPDSWHTWAELVTELAEDKFVLAPPEHTIAFIKRYQCIAHHMASSLVAGCCGSVAESAWAFTPCLNEGNFTGWATWFGEDTKFLFRQKRDLSDRVPACLIMALTP